MKHLIWRSEALTGGNRGSGMAARINLMCIKSHGVRGYEARPNNNEA